MVPNRATHHKCESVIVLINLQIVSRISLGPPNQLSRGGSLMKIKRPGSNLLILCSPGGTKTVSNGDTFLKIRVPR